MQGYRPVSARAAEEEPGTSIVVGAGGAGDVVAVESGGGVEDARSGVSCDPVSTAKTVAASQRWLRNPLDQTRVCRWEKWLR